MSRSGIGDGGGEGLKEQGDFVGVVAHADAIQEGLFDGLQALLRGGGECGGSDRDRGRDT